MSPSLSLNFFCNLLNFWERFFILTFFSFHSYTEWSHPILEEIPKQNCSYPQIHFLNFIPKSPPFPFQRGLFDIWRGHLLCFALPTPQHKYAINNTMIRDVKKPMIMGDILYVRKKLLIIQYHWSKWKLNFLYLFPPVLLASTF